MQFNFCDIIILSFCDVYYSYLLNDIHEYDTIRYNYISVYLKADK